MIDKPSLLDTPNLANRGTFIESPVPGDSVDTCYAWDSAIRGDYNTGYAPDWDDGKLIQETLPAAQWDAFIHDINAYNVQTTDLLISIWEELYCLIHGAQAGYDQEALTQLLSGAQTFTNKTISLSDNSLTTTASRAIISDSNGKLTASTTTSTELGYVSGVTSAIQTQLNGKEPTITGAATTIASSDLTASRALISNASGKVAASSVTSTELGYVSGVTSAIQTQLNGKEATITGAASTITSSNLTASKVLVSDANGKVTTGSVAASNIVGTEATQTLSNKTYLLGTANKVCITNSSKQMTLSTVSDTELGYLSGVTANVQTQLNTVSGRTSALTYDSFTINGGGYGLTYTCYVAKRNGIITLQAYGSHITSNIPALTTLYSSTLVPAAYRPRLNATYIGFNATGSQDLNYSIAITTEGYLILYTASGGWYTTWSSNPTIYGLTYVANTV